MAPDSKETAIASDVDHHYVPRIVLPTLAAGIQGLGQALALSGSSVFSGPYGASQNYNTFNGVVQIRVTPKTRNPLTIKALSISGVTWKWVTAQPPLHRKRLFHQWDSVPDG